MDVDLLTKIDWMVVLVPWKSSGTFVVGHVPFSSSSCRCTGMKMERRICLSAMPLTALSGVDDTVMQTPASPVLEHARENSS